MAGPDEPEGEVRGGGGVTGAGEVAPQTTVTYSNYENYNCQLSAAIDQTMGMSC